jgi:hypothetical protein
VDFPREKLSSREILHGKFLGDKVSRGGVFQTGIFPNDLKKDQKLNEYKSFFK